MSERKFGFIEMIGSIVLVLLDPVRTNNKKYLDKSFYKLNRMVGFIALIIFFLGIIYLVGLIIKK